MASQALAPAPPRPETGRMLAAFVALSLLAHGAALAFLARGDPGHVGPPMAAPLEVVLFDEPPPPPVASPPEPKIKVASTRARPPARPKVDAPPPPNQEAVEKSAKPP